MLYQGSLNASEVRPKVCCKGVSLMNGIVKSLG